MISLTFPIPSFNLREATIALQGEHIMSLNILLVDDEPEDIEVFLDALKDAGYTVIESRSTRHILDLLKDPELKCDVLVTDYYMEPIDGWGLVRAMRELTHRQHAPFVIHTGAELQTVRAMRRYAKENGGRVIKKNFENFNELLRTIEKVVRLQKEKEVS